MSERFPKDTITVDHLSTILLLIACIALLPLLFIMAVRVSVPAAYEPVLPGIQGSHMVIFGLTVFILFFIFIIGYYRPRPPTRVATDSSDEGVTEIVAGSLAIGVIGAPMFLFSILFLGSNISDGSGAFVHGLAALIPVFVWLAVILSAIAGLVEARRLANQRSG